MLQYVALLDVALMKQLPTDLGDLEREVLELVWQRGDATADQIRQALKRALK
jgi:predicted transcriptional regulator